MNILLGKSWRAAVAISLLLTLTAGLAGAGRTSVSAQGLAYKKVGGVSGNPQGRPRSFVNARSRKE